MITQPIIGNILLITKKLSNWFANIPSNVLLVKKSGAKNSVINESNSIFLNYSSTQIWFYTIYMYLHKLFSRIISLSFLCNHFILSMCLDISFSVKSQCEALSNWLPFLSTKQGSNIERLIILWEAFLERKNNWVAWEKAFSEALE